VKSTLGPGSGAKVPRVEKYVPTVCKLPRPSGDSRKKKVGGHCGAREKSRGAT